MDKKYYDEKIRKIPNFPKEGILFYDITTLLEDPRAFQSCIDDLYDYFKFDNIDKVVGIDARGFLLASTLAYKLGAGVSIVRKKGKLPYKTKSSQYEKEYGSDTLEMHEDAIKPEEKVIIIDDLLATGGTILGSIDLVKQMGGEIIGIGCIIALTFLPGLQKLRELGYKVSYLIDYDNEKISSNIKIGIIGGSGLDDPEFLQNYSQIDVDTPYGKPSSLLITGKLNGVEVVFLSRHGKDHSIMPTRVLYQANIWALKEIGCTHIIATTACGSLREYIKPGDFVFPDQCIDATKQRALTFFEDKVVHTPLADPFCQQLRNILSDTAKAISLPCHNKGTVITIEGPRFSTRAESNMYRLWSADVINMSTCPEMALARELGMCYQPIAMSTDYDCWKENETPVTFEMVMEKMKQNSENVKKLIILALPKIQFTECVCKKSD
ncbi:MAG: hypothetical protein US74_C0007G0009 [Parcubacteria group bacterium GW2011_GWA2_38_13]|nr:MAG: hypothetical protein US74_C0007G0009 [Parcubacteria group bacterium GW2011_GWA2_38_13]